MSHIKAAFIILVVCLATPPMIVAQYLTLRFAPARATRIPLAFHRMVRRLLGIRVILRGAEDAQRPLLMTANHMSWLDITVLGSLAPVAFIAKKDVASWPVFGLFAKLQRSVFVDRERRNETRATAHEIADRMQEGVPLVLFAEGTSGDGNGVLPFRSALIGAAQKAAQDADGVAHIQPVSLAYVRRGGLPLSRNQRAQVAWYGDMPLMPHLYGIVRGIPVDVVVTFGEVVDLRPGDDRKALARALEGEVRAMTRDAILGRPFPPAAPAMDDGEAALPA